MYSVVLKSIANSMKTKQSACNSQAVRTHVVAYILLVGIFGKQGKDGKLTKAVNCFLFYSNEIMKTYKYVYICCKELKHHLKPVQRSPHASVSNTPRTTPATTRPAATPSGTLPVCGSAHGEGVLSGQPFFSSGIDGSGT